MASKPFTTRTQHVVSNLKLFHYPLSRSLRVLFALHEAGVPCEIVHVKLMKGEGYSPEFLRLNPFHAVPVMTLTISKGGETKEMVLPESAAIVRFVSEFLAPSNVRLMPSIERGDAPDVVADFECQFAFATTTMDTILWWFRVLFDFRGGAERDLLQSYASRWNDEVLPQLEKKCGEANKRNGYASVWGFSILDCILAQNLNWSIKYARGGLIKPLGPEAEAYRKRVCSRPAFKLATQDAMLFEKDADPSIKVGVSPEQFVARSAKGSSSL